MIGDTNWNVAYHREKLEQYSGQRWAPAPETLSVAVRQEERLRGQLKSARRLMRIATSLLLICVPAVIAGIILGGWSSMVGINAGGGAAALIIPNLLLSGAAIAGRVYLVLRIIPRLEDEHDASAEVLRRRVDAEIGGAA